MKNKVRPLLSAAALITSSLALTALPASAAVGEHTVTTPSTATVDAGTPVQPFADAVLSGNGDIEGLSIYIETGHEASVDLLTVTSIPSGVTTSYDATTGLLRLRGTASIANYQTAVRSITYAQTAGTAGSRGFLIVAAPMLYLEETGNLYEFVDAGSSISWTDARAAANLKTFDGISGHLVNISSEAENTIANAEILGNTWIGATDQAVEGTWVWADGPEAGQEFWSGLGSGDGGTPTSDAYNNWAGTLEPNDYGGGGEDFAHMFVGNGQWNDYPESSNVTGYLVEYEIDDIGDVVSRVSLTVVGPPCVRTLTGDYTNASGTEGQLARLYMATFHRQPDAAGFAYWTDRVASGYPIWDIAAFFANSPEFTSTYGTLSEADFMELMYENIMCRSSDSEGKTFWRGQLESESLTRSQVLLLLADSPEFRDHTVSN